MATIAVAFALVLRTLREGVLPEEGNTIIRTTNGHEFSRMEESTNMESGQLFVARAGHLPSQ